MDPHDWVGLLGAGLIVGTYSLLQMERVSGTSVVYFAMNGVGASLVLVSLTAEFNLSAFLIEAFWLLVSLAGVIKHRGRQKAT